MYIYARVYIAIEKQTHARMSAGRPIRDETTGPQLAHSSGRSGRKCAVVARGKAVRSPACLPACLPLFVSYQLARVALYKMNAQ